ncbi:MAG: response regulator [Opitutales bacterium]
MLNPALQPWAWNDLEDFESLGIKSMDRAADGSYWFGGAGRIINYDGWELREIPLKEDEDVEEIAALNNGDVLVVTREGFYAWSDNDWKFLRSSDNNRAGKTQLVKTSNNGVFLKFQKKLRYFEPDTLESQIILELGVGEAIRTMCLDPQGSTLWLVYSKDFRNGELFRIPLVDGKVSDRSEWKTYGFPEALSGQDLTIVCDLQGRLWYSSRLLEKGVLCFDIDRESWVVPDFELEGGGYQSSVRDQQGRIWMISSGGILMIPQKGRPFYQSLEMLGLGTSQYRMFGFDDDALWMLGTMKNYRLALETDHMKAYRYVSYHGETPDGLRWLMMARDSVVSLDLENDIATRYEVEDGLFKGLKGIHITGDGHVLVYGNEEGHLQVARFTGNGWERFAIPKMAGRIVRDAVAEDADGVVWIGVGNRLLSLELSASGELAASQIYLPGIGTSQISKIASSPDGTLWLKAGALHQYTPSINTTQRVRRPVRGDIVDLLVDREGALWMTQGFEGILKYADESWQSVSESALLAGEFACDLLQLEDGSLLLSTNRGISRFDGTTWARDVFGEDFGMSPNHGTLHRDSDGYLWISMHSDDTRSPESRLLVTGMKHLIRYREDVNPPKVWLDEHFTDVGSHGNVNVSWRGRDFMDDTPAENVQYSWRLNGGEWSAYSTERAHSFVDLDSGEYLLEVRARDRDFNSSEQIAMSSFTVATPIWLRPWFIGLVALVCAGVIVSVVAVILRHRDRARHFAEINELKSAFFTNISHELRTPLTVISGPVRKMISDETDEAKKSSLRLMERNVDRLSSLITQLLDFRKIEENRIRLEITRSDLSKTLRDIMDSMRIYAESKDISYNFELSAEIELEWFDPENLEKILSNLVSNAIKYTHSKGCVRVMLGLRETAPGERYLDIVVEDDGKGISQEFLPHIFERFYRVPGQTVVNGSGIGLSLTNELVELWGGNIQAESPVHESSEYPGSRFSVTLPIFKEAFESESLIDSADPVVDTESDALPANQSTENGSPDSRLRVLVVEDDPDIRQFIISGLSDQYVVEEASDGSQGLEKALAMMPDIIVTDVMMPGIDGMELCERLKTAPETSHIPIIMLTAKSTVQSELEGLQKGADDYLSKPFHQDILLARIGNILQARRLLRERYLQDYMVAEKPERIDSPDEEFMKNVISVLDEHSGNPEFGVDEFAQKLNMSPRNLQRKLKSLTNETPAKLLVSTRLKKASELIKSSEARISEIAYHVGYWDPNLFSRNFKSHFGMSPSAYRTTSREEASS